MELLDILLVDDEMRRMRALIDMMRTDGFTVRQIGSPSEALALLTKNRAFCKVIILDIMMPADGEFDVDESQLGLRTGFLLLDKLQNISDFDIPIIVLTAASQFKDEIHDRVCRFHPKPVPYEALKDSILFAIESKGGEKNGTN